MDEFVKRVMKPTREGYFCANCIARVRVRRYKLIDSDQGTATIISCKECKHLISVEVTKKDNDATQNVEHCERTTTGQGGHGTGNADP